VFPCHSSPADGTTFTLDVTNVPAGKTAVFPATIPSEAPSYQVAWSIDAYTELPLGTTTAGTQLSVWHRATEATSATSGTVHLRDAFDWLERTIGPYKFGPKAGTVSTGWGPGAFGGMEHHPYWHVGSAALGDIETNIHEAAHGWFGGGVRIQCWEDFVLSEGTVTYLAGRALDAVAPAVGAQIWTSYEQDLAAIDANAKVWPATCNAIDILKDKLFTRAPYMRGAFFYRAVALKVGADKLDEAIAAFYAAHATKPATMASMLTTIAQVTGYDPTTCADMWLRSTTKPAVGACP
jgi:aminopeptidase N